MGRRWAGCAVWIAGVLLALMAPPRPAPAGEAPAPAEGAAVFVNQLGYRPGFEKIALVSSPIGLPFTLEDAHTGRAELKGMLSLARPNDETAGAHLWKADFSAVDASGTYRVAVPGRGASFSFPVRERPYAEAAARAAKSFYFNRAGLNLEKPFAESWARPALHPNTAMVSGTTIVQWATGGWHDGGDTGRYVVSGAFAAGMLLSLHEHWPDAFPDGSLGIPESGNGTPDLLDEVRWELEWFFHMQMEDGAVRHKLTPLEPETGPPPNARAQLYLMPPSMTATAGFCAVMARAARLFEPHDSAFAARCLGAALRALNWLDAHPDHVPFENPPGVRTKPYSDEDGWDERFWALAELYATTREDGYLERARAMAEERVPLLPSAGYWGNTAPLAADTLLLRADGDAEPAAEARRDAAALADVLLDKARENGMGLTLAPGEFAWGSNGMALQNTLILWLAHRSAPEPELVRCAMDQLHYLLGRNPLSMCYVTGLGSRPPQNPFYPLAPGNAKAPVPGLLVGGPNQFLNDGALKRHFSANSAPASVYRDDGESYSSNETSIAWNAALALACAWLDRAEPPSD